jgi:hypothetical protein
MAASTPVQLRTWQVHLRRLLTALRRANLNRHFPEDPVSHFVCHSWLLDPQHVRTGWIAF